MIQRDQLFFNDVEIYLDPGTSIAITSQINNVGELRNHQSTLSNKFRVPFTSHNITQLGNSEQVQSLTQVPYRKNGCRVVRNGVDILKNGFAIVENVGSAFNLSVYQGNLDFFEDIALRNLTDLDWTDINHIWNFSNIVDTRAYPWDTYGFKYSFINYGRMVNNSRTVDVRELRPLLFMKKIFMMIVEQAGFTVVGDFIDNNDEFNRLLLTTDNGSSGTIYFDKLQRVAAKPWFSDPPTLPAAWDPTMVLMKLGETWAYSIRLVFKISGWGGGSHFRIDITLPDSAGTGTTGVPYYNHSAGNGTFDMTFTWTSFNGNAYTTDFYDISNGMRLASATLEILFGEFTGTKDGSSEPDFKLHFTPHSFTAGAFGMSMTWGLDLLTQYGYSLWDFRKTITDMNQKDYVKTIAQIFQLMFDTDPQTKVITIKQFKEIVAAIPDALDLSHLLDDRTENYLIETRIGYAQQNNFRYTRDTDDKLLPENFADGSLDIDDQTLEPQQETVQLPYAPSYMEKEIVNLDVPRIQKYDENNERTIANVPRILLDDTAAIEFGDEVTWDDTVDSFTAPEDVPICHFVLAAKAVNLAWPDSLLPDNYTEFGQVLKQTKKVTVPIWWTEILVYALSHFRPIFLKQFSSYFYLNRLLNYTGLGPTKTELIRIGAKVTSLPVKRQRCHLGDGENLPDYGPINREWPAGTHYFTVTSLKLNGIQYSTGQHFLANAPGDLSISTGFTGDNYVQDINMGINAMITALDLGLEDLWEFYDDMTFVDKPTGQPFEIIIRWSMTSYADAVNCAYYRYNQFGFMVGSADPDSVQVPETQTYQNADVFSCAPLEE